ncbi:nucleocapsid protein [Escherichia coli]|nr:nucleocapsid protein [Escherichia coli]
MAYEPCQGVIIGVMPQHVLAYDVLRLAGEVSIVLVLNDFQPLSILRIFCMRGFAPPPTYPP